MGEEGRTRFVEKARVSHGVVHRVMLTILSLTLFSLSDSQQASETHTAPCVASPPSFPTAHILSFEALCPLLLVLSAAPGRALTISFTFSPAVDIERQPALYKASSVSHCS